MDEPVRLDPDALYDDRLLRLQLGLSDSSLMRARKTGELRFTRRGGRILYLGAWVHQWLIGDPTTPTTN